MGGCEEYSFSQPATRRQRFDARLIVALGCLLAITLMNIVALQNNLTDLVLRLLFHRHCGRGIALARVPLRVRLVPVGRPGRRIFGGRPGDDPGCGLHGLGLGRFGALTGLRAGLSWRIPLGAPERTHHHSASAGHRRDHPGISRRLYVDKEAGRVLPRCGFHSAAGRRSERLRWWDSGLRCC